MYDPDNIFAKIIRGEIPCSKVYEDDRVMAFRDISPAAPVHILVVPKGEYESFDDFTTKAEASEIQHFFATVQKIAKDNKLVKSGYRIITNHGPDASQTVQHFHFHILGGKAMGGLLPASVRRR